MILIPKRAATVLGAASGQDGSRYALAAVRIREWSDCYWVEATDGRVLAVARGPAPEAPIPPPEMEGEPSFDYLVGADVWKAAWKGGPEVLGFASDGKQVWICTPHGQQRYPIAEGRFPNTDEVVRVQRPSLLTVRVSAKLLGSLAAMSRAFGLSSGEPSPSLLLGLSSATDPVLFLTLAEGGHMLEGLLMPLSNEDIHGYEPGSQPDCKREGGPSPHEGNGRAGGKGGKPRPRRR
jgi:hypothetical protein